MIENRNDFSRTESVNILPVKTQWLNYYKANELCGVWNVNNYEEK